MYSESVFLWYQTLDLQVLLPQHCYKALCLFELNPEICHWQLSVTYDSLLGQCSTDMFSLQGQPEFQVSEVINLINTAYLNSYVVQTYLLMK